MVWVFVEPLTDPLLIFLLQLALVLALTRTLGACFSYIKQPQVIGEIIAGIILGPSVMGHIPGFTNTVFPTAAQLSPTTKYNSVQTFSVVANTGLILFMFMMGLELDRGLIQRHLRQASVMAACAIVFPFAVGCAVATWLQSVNNENQPATWVQPDSTAFLLFSGASMTFTAFPVLAAILKANNLLTAPLGVTAMSAAAIDDVAAWCMLAISSSFAKNNSPIDGFYTLCLSVAYVVIMVFMLRPSLEFAHHKLVLRGLHTNRYYLSVIIVLLIGSAYATEVIGIHCFFGAFLFGLITPHEGGFNARMIELIETISTEVLLPLYFALNGIRTDLGTLNTARYWGIVLAVILIATAAKFLPACLATKALSRRSWRFSITVGSLMNTRGLVEIIALNVGLTLGILSTRLFTILVLMAIGTTVLTSPLVWYLWMRVYPDGLEPQDREMLVQGVVPPSDQVGNPLREHLDPEAAVDCSHSSKNSGTPPPSAPLAHAQPAPRVSFTLERAGSARRSGSVQLPGV